MKRSGHNLKISKFRQGCRLPCESSRVGDGYAASGPVKTYKLSPEELERYRNLKPVGKRQNRVWLLNPKTRRENMASIMEKAREVLPKDKLGVLLAEKRTQQSIADEYEVPYWAISELKKQYWPGGFNPAEFQQQQTAGNAANPGNGEAQEATPEPEEKRVEASRPPATVDELSEVLAWAKPVRLGTGGVVLKIYEDRISISSAAVKLLRPAEFIRIGVLKNGALALAPAENITEGFRFAQNHSHIGGGALVRFLKKHGFGPGEYELEKNEKGWLVTRR